MTSVTVNTRPQKRRRTEDTDELSDETVKSAHDLLDVFLTKDHGPSKSSCVRELTPAQTELVTTENREAYFRDRVAHLTEKVEAQQTIRENYRISRQSRLPMEIILETLSYFSSEHVLNLPGIKGVEAKASGILPYLIIKRNLLLPPYCHSNTAAAETLDEISSSGGGANLELNILTDVDIARSVKIKVEIFGWPVNGIHEDGLCTLLQVSNRWEELSIRYKDTANIIPVINYFSSCFPYISRLYAMAYVVLELTASPLTSDIILTAPSLKAVSASAYILPALFGCGILNFVSELVLDFEGIDEHLGTHPYDHTELVQILSTLPHLNTFTVDEYVYNPIDKARVAVPKIKSGTLQHIKIVESHGSDFESNPKSLFALFEDCPIRCLDLNFCHLVLGPPSNFFPGLKQIKISGEENLIFLCSLGTNGRAVFPQVEELTFEGSIEFERLRELILKVVQSRTCTSGVTPIKRVLLNTWNEDDDDPPPLASQVQLRSELEKLVRIVECVFE